jgi:hypothetical protein
MSREKAIEFLMSLGWDFVGAEAIIDELESAELDVMTETELKALSDDYIDR